jgi:hypothetical protein
LDETGTPIPEILATVSQEFGGSDGDIVATMRRAAKRTRMADGALEVLTRVSGTETVREQCGAADFFCGSISVLVLH